MKPTVAVSEDTPRLEPTLTGTMFWRVVATALGLSVLTSLVVPYVLFARHYSEATSGRSTVLTPFPALYSAVVNTGPYCREGDAAYSCQEAISVDHAAAAKNLLVHFTAYLLVLLAATRILRHRLPS